MTRLTTRHLVALALATILTTAAETIEKKESFMPKPKSIDQVDKNMARSGVSNMRVVYMSIDTAPLRLTGLYFRAAGDRISRLPNNPELPENVIGLGFHTAGAQLAFKTDSPVIRLKYKHHDGNVMYHMAFSGSAGFDLYEGAPGNRRMIGVTRVKVAQGSYEVDILPPTKFPRQMREYLIHFPLYAGLERVEIGFAPDAKIEPPTPWADERPIVYYGTSITQGGCASRSGMCDSNILSRKWNVPILNFGFSGNGKGEKSVINTLAQVKNPRLFILDYAANAGVTGIKNTLGDAIDILKKAHPGVPIAVMTGVYNSGMWWRNGGKNPVPAFREMVAEVKRRHAAGDKDVYLINAEQTPEDDWDEQTVDGCHLTDYGFVMKARRIAPQIEAILKNYK